MDSDSILLAPIGSSFYQVYQIIKKDNHGKMHVEKSFPVAFVPLTSKKEQLNNTCYK